MKKVRVCLVGRGSIGIRHLRNLKLLSIERVIAYSKSKNKEKDARVKSGYGVKTVNKIKELRNFKPDAFIIANPTAEHLKTANVALDLGAHIFMEKPISHTLAGLDRLKKRLQTAKCIFFSANNFRFHPALVKIKKMINEGKFGKILFARIQAGQYLVDWHPWEDYRKSYAAQRKLGGGAVLALEHEIDYAYWLFGRFRKIKSFVKKTGFLDINVEDLASVIIETESGTLIEMHLDYLQRPAKRTIQIQGTKGSIDYYFGDKFLKFYSHKHKKYKKIADLKDYDNNDMYLEEMQHFIRCIQRKIKPKVGFKDAVYGLKTCLEIKKAMRT